MLLCRQYKYYSLLLLYARMLQETETEETMGFVVIIFIIGGDSIGELGPRSLAMPMVV